MARRPAGEYIHPITVSQYGEAASAAGQLLPTATVFCNRYARMGIPNGREIVLPEGQQTLGLNDAIFLVGWDKNTAAINSKMVLTCEGNTYEITAARDVTGRREEIQINAIMRVE